MKSPNDNPLLRELLADETLSAVRRASLARSLSLIRRRRRARQAVQLAVLVVFAVWAVFVFLERQPPQNLVSSIQTNWAAVVPTLPLEPSVQAITDEELFALFPDRAVALIGRPGHQEFVVLSAPSRN